MSAFLCHFQYSVLWQYLIFGLQNSSTFASISLLKPIREIICSNFLCSWLYELVHPPCFVPFSFGNSSATVYLVYWPWKPLRFASVNCLRLLWLQILNHCPDRASGTPPAPSHGKEITFDFFGQHPSCQVHSNPHLFAMGTWNQDCNNVKKFLAMKLKKMLILLQ